MFDGLNSLIQQTAEQGQSGLMFTLIQLLNIPFGLIHALWFGYKFKFGIKKTIALFFASFVSIYVWMLVLHWASTGFSSFGGQNMVMVFVWVPLLAVGLSRMFKVDWTAECCIHAASLPLSHGIGHIACLFKGCCSGYAASWGVYNPRCDGITFPIQLIESLASLTIAIILMVRTHKNNYVASEKEYPLMLVMYGGVRFILEFFRDNEKIVLGCSGLAFHALFMLLVGIVWLVRIKKKAEEEAAPVLPVLKGRRR